MGKQEKRESKSTTDRASARHPSDLEDCEKALVEAVKVSSRLLRQGIIVEPGSKNLHPQQGKDAHEQKEQQKQ